MSGGSFDYAYLKLEDYVGYKEVVDQAIALVSNLMRDVEWVTSGDSSWDTKMAAGWYQQVYNLCAKVANQYILEEPRAPEPPTHYPWGKVHCQYCGAEQEHWHEEFKLIRRKRYPDQ